MNNDLFDLFVFLAFQCQMSMTATVLCEEGNYKLNHENSRDESFGKCNE